MPVLLLRSNFDTIELFTLKAIVLKSDDDVINLINVRSVSDGQFERFSLGVGFLLASSFFEEHPGL